MANFSKPANMMSVVFGLLALLQFTAAFGHGAHQHAHRSNFDQQMHDQIDEVADQLQARQNSGRIAISGVCSTGTRRTGACNSNGRQSYPRLEIRQLARNSDQWNLYLLGMERFMAKDKSDTLSYYQIAGIHGRPFVTWNGFPTPLLNQAGFCPHGQTLFGTWHRPYLAIYEQAWYLSVLEVIDQFPRNQRQRWNTAASTLRMPYWDWAMETNGAPTVPTLIRDKTVSVTKPQGRVSIQNPLYSYSWGASLPNEMGGGPWNNFPVTLRRPVANPTRSNNNEVNAIFNNMRISLRDRTFALFSSKQPWGDATTSAITVQTDLGDDSFEGVHDTVHSLVGGDSGGHMGYLDVAAFDPIFWLHHTNVDRLISMYQYIVPNTWVSQGTINNPMAQWNVGEVKNSGSPLKPFCKNSNGDYYSSNDVKETRTLGYYYPETSDRTYGQVAQAVTRLYGAGVRSITKRASPIYGQNGQYLGRPLKEGDYHHVLSVTAEKFAMDGSYTVHCFIGNNGNSTGNATAPYPISNSTTSYVPKATPSGFPTPYNGTNEPEEDYDPSHDFTNSPDYVGAYSVLGGQKAHGDSSSVITRGSLPLTTCLQGKEYNGQLKSLKPEDVEPYLQKNMYYKIMGPNGEIDPTTIKNFHVTVACTKVVPAKSDDELPDLSAPYQILPKISTQLPAGKPMNYIPPGVYPTPPGGSYNEPNGDGTTTQPQTPNPSSGGWPYPVAPEQEQGYCAVQQTVKYVYPDGSSVQQS